MTCFAVGDYGTIVTTIDGTNWSAQTLGAGSTTYPDGLNLYGISCPSTPMCVAVGGFAYANPTSGATEDSDVILITTNGGFSWTGKSIAPNWLRAVSCASTTVCVAVGDRTYKSNGGVHSTAYTIFTTTDGGSSWVAQVTPLLDRQGFAAVSCPSISVCFAVGGICCNSAIVTTIDGGNTWSVQIPGTTNLLYGVSCASTSTCVAVGSTGTVVATTNGGASWSVQSSGSTKGLSSATCPNASTCFAVGVSGTILTTTNGGNSWSVQTPTGSTDDLSSASCTSVSTCFIVGASGAIVATTNFGNSWSVQRSGPIRDLKGISCPSAPTCFAVGGPGAILATVDGGANWSVQTSGTTKYLFAVSCPTASACIVVGDAGTILGTTNGGASWSPQNSGVTLPLYAVSCPSISTCYAVGAGPFQSGGTILTTTDGGASWIHKQTSSADGDFSYGVSCPTITTCFAVGDNLIEATIDGGATWSRMLSYPTISGTTFRGVSCPSTSVCFAVGDDHTLGDIGQITSTTDGGTTWSRQYSSTNFTDPQFNGVSCPTISTCVTVSGGYFLGLEMNVATIRATRDGGASWSQQSSGTDNWLFGVNCPAVLACVVVGSGGTTLANTATSHPAVTAVTPSSGPSAGGSTVTITGTNLTGATLVRFGSLAAVGFAVNSATSITATSPAGSGTVDVTVTTPSGTSTVSAADRFTYLLPALALPAVANNAYGGYTTVVYIENTGDVPARAALRYFDSAGNPTGIGDSIGDLPPGSTWMVRQDNGDGLPPSQAGSAVVYSDQPIAAFVNEFASGGGDATSYTAIKLGDGTGATLYVPAIANNAYGGYTTGIGLVNVGGASTNLTVTYRDGSGSVARTQTLSGVAAGAYRGLYSGDATLGLPAGFAGTATITSSAGPVAAVVNETGPGGQFSSYDAVPMGRTTLYAPAALRNAYGGFNTGVGIQNTTGTGGTVTITYYDGTGTIAATKSNPIAANGYLGVYQGTDIPVDGPYTATLTSTVAIAAIVNEVAPSSTPAKQFTAYNTFAAGSSSLHLPLVESAGSDGWSTGEGIMNTGTAATTITVTYYDAATGVQVGTPQSLLLQPNAFWGPYQPAGGLPAGLRASAVVTTSGGGQVAAICNESNATSFMSYSGQ